MSSAMDGYFCSMVNNGFPISISEKIKASLDCFWYDRYVTGALKILCYEIAALGSRTLL